MENRQEKKDQVTVGQIRGRYLKILDEEIDVLGKLIRQGYFKLPEAEKYLNDAIATTLTTLQNIDAMASAVSLGLMANPVAPPKIPSDARTQG